MFVLAQLVAVIVTMLVLNEACLVAMLMPAVLNGNSNIEAVRFRYLIDGLPIGPVILELKCLSAT
jgi:hypothetical protein